MNSRPIRLQKRDRPDFERVLHQAMSTDRVREGLRSAPAPDAATALQAEAREATDRIMSAASTEYAAFLKLRAGADKRAARRTRPTGVRGRGLLAALAVLAPAISGAAAVIFLVLGSVLQLADVQKGLGHSLVLTGWACAGIGAVSLAAATSALLITALRNRAASKRSHGRAGELERARKAWQTALLERGMLPFLQRLLEERHTKGTSEPALPEPPGPDRSPRRYSSPDFTGPDYSGPDFGRS
ncbi:hypothetical protein [Streptomyces iconiensis]|uniref:Transmembrane protein n=1 Tax=Streptomyces iconiensis TaxID=1384038 RepID=A0ABT6ZZ90_9ACTN|nr:hypothetical protein [Streptomyces iconiensis]MDJ1134356.1 hypothetical protein [Streptomyces iconiensis]